MTRTRECKDCGFPHGRKGVCIAREQERKRPGYRPGFKEPLQQTAKHEPMPVQTGPQRG